MAETTTNKSPEARPAQVSKYKPRPGRGLQSKVFALEDQMRQVQSSIDNVVSLLHRTLAPGATIPVPENVSNGSRLGGAGRSSIGSSGPWQPFPSLNHLRQDSGSDALTQAHSLEQWVRQIGSVPPALPSHAAGPITANGAVTQVPAMAVGPSRNESSEEEGDEEEEEGLLLMRDMLRKEESARLRADGHASPKTTTSHQAAPMPQHHYSQGRWSGQPASSDPWSVDVASRKRKHPSFAESMLQRGPIRGSIPDPIDLGLCTEEQGQELFRLFFKCAHTFMPVYDPAYDTWTSLRQRSAFSTTSILYVGKKIQDAGNEPSDLQRSLREHAENIGKTTLFSPISTIEALQAMIVLASWGDTGWRPGSHALSMALDMELHDCLPRLAETSSLPTPADPAASRALIVGSRLWLLVSKMAIEMAYNHGRPLGVDEGDVLPNAHALLNHPSGLPTDSRTIAACELLLLRLPLHRLLLAKDTNNLDRTLQVFNEGSRAWQARWQEYYLQRGVSQDDLLVTDLTTQRCFGSVLANSRLLRDIRSAADVDKLPPHRRRWLESSLEDAKLVVAHVLTKEKDKLLHANHYSHVALASVSRIYLRLASLLPGSVDLRRTAKDLTQLADVLAQFPGFHFAQQLRRIIGEARKRRFLPPETRPGSPKNFSMDLALGNDHHRQFPEATFGSVPQTNSDQSPFDFDVFAAEQLFTEGFGQPYDIAGQNQWNIPFTDQTYSTQQQNDWGMGAQLNFLPWLGLPALEIDPPFNLGPSDTN